MEPEQFINAKDSIKGPTTFWSERLDRTVSLEGNDVQSNGFPLALITNDGRFLVIVFVNPPMSGQIEALRVYEWLDGSYQIEKSVAIGELLTPTQIDPRYAQHSGIPPSASATDSSPQWFAGGSLEFSADDRQLIHKTRWGNTIRTELAKGSR